MCGPSTFRRRPKRVRPRRDRASPRATRRRRRWAVAALGERAGLVRSPRSSKRCCAPVDRELAPTTRAPAIRAPCADPAEPRSRRTGPSLRRRWRRSCSGAQLPAWRADAQSMAFFSTPGIEPLYSGVTTKSASAASIRSRRSRDGLGGRSSPCRGPGRTAEEAEPVVELDVDALRARARRPRGRGPCCTTRPGGCRRWRGPSRYAAVTAAKSALRTTSFGSRKPPPGSGAFHSSPNSVRSIVPASSSPMRSFPYGSVPAPM